MALAALTPIITHAQADRFANVSIEVTHISGPAHMLQGQGGNIGVSVSDDDVLLIDEARWTSIIAESDRANQE